MHANNRSLFLGATQPQVAGTNSEPTNLGHIELPRDARNLWRQLSGVIHNTRKLTAQANTSPKYLMRKDESREAFDIKKMLHAKEKKHIVSMDDIQKITSAFENVKLFKNPMQVVTQYIQPFNSNECGLFSLMNLYQCENIQEFIQEILPRADVENQSELYALVYKITHSDDKSLDVLDMVKFCGNLLNEFLYPIQSFDESGQKDFKTDLENGGIILRTKASKLDTIGHYVALLRAGNKYHYIDSWAHAPNVAEKRVQTYATLDLYIKELMAEQKKGFAHMVFKPL